MVTIKEYYLFDLLVIMISWQYRFFSGLLSFLPLKIRLQVLYFRRFKKLINFNNPLTLNEKIQYRKIHDRNPIYKLYADKVLVKNYIKNLELDIYVPKMYWSGIDVIDADFSKIPDKFVFKANHASQTNYIHSNGEVNLLKLKKLQNEWFNHSGDKCLGEWGYKNIPKKVFVEEFLDFDGKAPDDYKFFVYSGKVKFIQIDKDRFSNHQRSMFTRDWCELQLDYSYPRIKPKLPKPEFLDEMIAMAEVIAGNHDFLRVDLYFYKNKITFGEITMYPGSGFERFQDDSFDLLFGKDWIIK